MKTNFFKTTKRSFFSIVKFIFFLIICALASFVITLPLWVFATKVPFAYTIFSLAIFGSLLCFWFVKKTKTLGAKKIVKIILTLCILFALVALAFYFVFSGKRFFALPVVIAIPFAIIFINTIFQTK